MKKGLWLAILTLFLVGCNETETSSNVSSSSSSNSNDVTSSSTTTQDESSSSSTSLVNVPVTGISIDQGDGPYVVTLANEKYTLSATVSPANATNKKTSWSSSNTSVATVNQGTLFVKSVGETTITVKSQDNSEIQDSILVRVGNVEATEIILSQSTITLKTGKTTKLVATVKPDNATIKTVNWSSSNSSVASVSSDGTITTTLAGSATITATSGNARATCIVNVEQSHLSQLPTIEAFKASTNPQPTPQFFKVNSSYKDVVTNVGDGVEMHTYTIPLNRGINATSRSLIVDLSKANLEIGTPNNIYTAQPAYVGQTLPYQLKAYEAAAKKGQKVLGGTNADFFGWNTKTNVTAANNVFVKDGVVISSKPVGFETLKSNMMVLGISYNDVPVITYSMKSDTDYVTVKNLVEIYNGDGTGILCSEAIDSINGSLISDPYQGASKPNNIQVYTTTGQSVSGKNVAIIEKIDKYDNGVGDINFPFDGYIKEIKENYTGAVTLTANQVAVASPYYNNVARNFVVGRLIRVGRVSCDGNEKLNNMKVIIGGRHELIRDSAVVSTVTKESTNQAQGYAARTSIGILNDGRLFIFTTSGVESDAMSLKEVADIMLYNGCRHAFNLDGGSSMGIYYDNGFNGSGDLIFIGGYNSRPLPNTLVVTTKPA